jgi:hypothetical protein
MNVVTGTGSGHCSSLLREAWDRFHGVHDTRDRFYLASSTVPLNSITNFKISTMKENSCEFHLRPFLKYKGSPFKEASIKIYMAHYTAERGLITRSTSGLIRRPPLRSGKYKLYTLVSRGPDNMIRNV